MKKKSYFIALIYLAAASFCAAFAAVYERFSHGVYSPFMVFAFLIPFIGGFIPYLLIGLLKGRFPKKLSFYLYNAGIGFLTIGSLMQGALEIYGTTNSLMTIYPVAGGVLLVHGIVLYLLQIMFGSAYTKAS